MAVTLRRGFWVRGSNEIELERKKKPMVVGSSSDFSAWKSEVIKGKPVAHAASSICLPQALRWWEYSKRPNMVEINSAQELVDSLVNAGDKLAIVDFYSPGCGGCKALHPKLCELAESNPDALFLKINHEENKSMCYVLNVHVLPFFRFYRGAQGRVCGFSCTNATIRKFKDALAKHGTDRCSLGPAKGLEESELLSLASIGELRFNHPSRFSRAKNSAPVPSTYYSIRH